MAKQYSVQELNEGWKYGLFTIEEVAENLADEDVFLGWPADIWKTAARDGEEYRAGKISGKELVARKGKLFSEENKLKEASALTEDKYSRFYSDDYKEWFIPVDGGLSELQKKFKEIQQKGEYGYLGYAMDFGIFAVPREDIKKWEQANKIGYERFHGSEIFTSEELFNEQPENIWIADRVYLDPSEVLKHSFKNLTVKFGIGADPYNPSQTTISYFKGFNGKGPAFIAKAFDIKGGFDAAKQFIDETIKHFDKEQNVNLNEMHDYMVQCSKNFGHGNSLLKHNLDVKYLNNYSLKSYLSSVEIKTIDDFKREMKALTRYYPDEFGKNSMKCAGAILDYADEKTRGKINSSLRALGCTNLDKTMRLMDSWAANGVQSPSRDLKAIRGRAERELMER